MYALWLNTKMVLKIYKIIIEYTVYTIYKHNENVYN